jgi:ATP phosphoribosyltransferase
LQEKDIPIQIAVGNYDLGICGLDWTEELLVKYPSSSSLKSPTSIWGGRAICRRLTGELSDPEKLSARRSNTRIAGEYSQHGRNAGGKDAPQAVQYIPLWGGAEVYPPEEAEIVLLPRKSEKEILDAGLSHQQDSGFQGVFNCQQQQSEIQKYGRYFIVADR